MADNDFPLNRGDFLSILNFHQFAKSRPARLFYVCGSLLLVVVFLWSGVSKAFSPVLFSETIGAYGLIPESLNLAAAIFLIIAEIVVAVGLLFGRLWALNGTTVLMLLFIGVLGYGIYLGLDIDCGCFGPEDPEAAAFHNLRSAFYRDLLLMVIVAYQYFWRFINRSKHLITPAAAGFFKKERISS